MAVELEGVPLVLEYIVTLQTSVVPTVIEDTGEIPKQEIGKMRAVAYLQLLGRIFPHLAAPAKLGA